MCGKLIRREGIMDITFEKQTEVLEHLDKARQLLRKSEHNRLSSDFRKAEIIDHITADFADVQRLDTQ